ncbi:MAG TPA: hydroxyisourate hydrolase [Candidatus Baltobacteraceae bacterium]
MSSLSTHVLDTARGLPASGIEVTLFAVAQGKRTEIARGVTNADGRVVSPFGGELQSGSYELLFSAGPYFAQTGTASFFDRIPVAFRIDPDTKHYHVPLLLAPWSYSTYRGS